MIYIRCALIDPFLSTINFYLFRFASLGIVVNQKLTAFFKMEGNCKQFIKRNQGEEGKRREIRVVLSWLI